MGFSRILDSLWDSHVVSTQISRQFDGEGLRIFYGFFTDSLSDLHVLWILCGILTYCPNRFLGNLMEKAYGFFTDFFTHFLMYLCLLSVISVFCKLECNLLH